MSLALGLPRERDQRQPNYDITPIKPHHGDIHKTLPKLLFVTYNLLRAFELCFHSVTCFHLPLISFINLFPVWGIIPRFWQFETAEKLYHALHEVACQRIRSVRYFESLGWITVNYLTSQFAYYQGGFLTAACPAAVCSSLSPNSERLLQLLFGTLENLKMLDLCSGGGVWTCLWDGLQLYRKQVRHGLPCPIQEIPGRR